jgi:hypothetical protein
LTLPSYPYPPKCLEKLSDKSGSAFRDNLLYYRERAAELGERAPVERTCEDVSFCGCLEAVTEGGEKRAEG